MVEKLSFETALVTSMARLRDVTLRDGIQSERANRYLHTHILPPLKEIDTLAASFETEAAKHATTKDLKFPPIEIFGGGQVLVPAENLGEMPFDNLSMYREVAPHLRFQTLYRGRQCYGYKPVSPDIQKHAVNESVARGTTEGKGFVVRPFDMMNHFEHVRPGIEATVEFAETQKEGEKAEVEGAISYMSANDKHPYLGPHDRGERAWSFEDYADYAVKMAKAGAKAIAVKDYAGQLLREDEAEDLYTVLRSALDKAAAEPGYEHLKDIPINLHSHGHKPELLAKWLSFDKTGKNLVDTAFGVLSDGPSHTNIRAMLATMMKAQGYELTPEHYRKNPLLKQIVEIENTIAEIDKIHVPYKFMIDPDPQKANEIILKSRLAGGGIAAAWEYVKSGYTTRTLSSAWDKVDWKAQSETNPILLRHGIAWHQPPTQEQFFNLMLKETAWDWEEAGQYDTVTPGATILYMQTVKRLMKELQGAPLAYADFDGEYRQVMLDRKGPNLGLHKGLGNQQLRDMFLADNMLGYLAKEIEPTAANAKSEEGVAACRMLINAGLSDFAKSYFDMSKRLAKCCDPKSPQYFAYMKENLDLARLRTAIEASGLPDAIKEGMLAESHPYVSETPTNTLADGERHLQELEAQGFNFPMKGDVPAHGGRLDGREYYAMLSELLQSIGSKPYAAPDAMFRYQGLSTNHPKGYRNNKIDKIEAPRTRHLEALLEPLINEALKLDAVTKASSNGHSDGNGIGHHVRQTKLGSDLTERCAEEQKVIRGKVEKVVSANFTPIVKELTSQYALDWFDSQVEQRTVSNRIPPTEVMRAMLDLRDKSGYKKSGQVMTR